jgi:hypothetical protein
MMKSLLVCLLVVVGGLMFNTSEASAHRRWRRPIARAVIGPRIVRRPYRAYRPYYAPRVRVGVGIGVGYGGYYGW